MRRSLALLALPLLLLTACGPTPEPTPTDDSPTTSKPTETLEAPAPEYGPDVLLVVTATATADNGAVVALSMQVHKALAWSDAASAELAAAMTSGCEGALDASVYEGNLWTFTAVDIAATPVSGSWPGDKRIHLFPIAGDGLSLASTGVLVEDDTFSAETPHCLRDRILTSSGDGTLVLGLEGDTDENTAAGNFTRWANHDYGFSGHEVAGQTAADAGITISDCVFTLTDAGTELNGGESWWHQLSNESDCMIGGGA